MKKPALILIWVNLVAFAAAEDPLLQWAAWRGPLGNGVAPHGDPPLKWDEKTNVKWKVAIPGSGHATPIIWGERVFVLSAVDTKKEAKAGDIPKPDERFRTRTKAPSTYHQFMVLCLDRDTGKVRWQQTAAERVPHEGLHDTNTYASGSPATDGRRLYVSFGSYGVYCYDLDGKLQWKRDDLGIMHTRLGWGEANTPVIHGDTLVLCWDHEGESFIAALDSQTGKTKWQKPRDEKSSWSTPLITDRAGRTQVIVNATNRVRSYDLKNGEVIWECGGQTANAIPTPVIDGDSVICMSGYRGSYAGAIPLDSTGDVTDKVAWKHTQGTPYVPSPLLHDGRLYFLQGNTNTLTSLDAKTGDAIIDRERLSGINGVYASPVAAGNRIYIAGRDGNTVVLKPGDKVEVLSTNPLDEGIDASPAIVGKQIFIRGKKHLYCLEQK
jgi:outer membrane protein assembly factor BamB